MLTLVCLPYLCFPLTYLFYFFIFFSSYFVTCFLTYICTRICSDHVQFTSLYPTFLLFRLLLLVHSPSFLIRPSTPYIERHTLHHIFAPLCKPLLSSYVLFPFSFRSTSLDLLRNLIYFTGDCHCRRNSDFPRPPNLTSPSDATIFRPYLPADNCSL